MSFGYGGHGRIRGRRGGGDRRGRDGGGDSGGPAGDGGRGGSGAGGGNSDHVPLVKKDSIDKNIISKLKNITKNCLLSFLFKTKFTT